MQFTYLQIKYYDGGAENSSDVLKLKPCQNRNGQKFASGASKMVSFFSATNCKKTPFLVQLKQIFIPSYFVTALIL